MSKEHNRENLDSIHSTQSPHNMHSLEAQATNTESLGRAYNDSTTQAKHAKDYNNNDVSIDRDSINDTQTHNKTETKARINADSNAENFHTDSPNKEGRVGKLTRAANDLSLGISMIVAVLLGLGFGYVLYKWLGYYWLIWVGLGYGVAAAILNVFKAYKRLHKELDSLKDDEKYKYMQDRILEKREKEAKERADKKA